MKWTNLGFASALLLLAVVGFVSYSTIAQISAAAFERGRARQTIQLVETLEALLNGAQSGERGFLLSGQESQLEPYFKGVAQIPELLDELRGVLEDSPELLSRVKAAAPLIESEMATFTRMIKIRRSSDLSSTLPSLVTAHQDSRMPAIDQALDGIAHDATAVLDRVAEQTGRQSRRGVVAATVVAFLLVTITAFFVIRESRALRKSEQQLRGLTVDLATQNQRVLEASALKSEFLANISHELRTPLNSILGFTQLLQDGIVAHNSASYRSSLQHISTSGKHLLQLINDILDLSKVEAGRLQFNPEPVELEKLLSEVNSTLSAAASSKSIDVKIDVDPTLKEIVLDSARLKQVLYNYLSNALKFTLDGGRVEVRMKPEGGQYFRIEVEDSGIGIGEHDLDRLFSKFEQLDSPASKEQGGTGLGLALTKRLVESQGGSVGVTSQPGKGSIFYAVLPRKFFGTGAFQQTVAGSLEDAKVPPDLSNVFARALTSVPSPPTPPVRTGVGS